MSGLICDVINYCASSFSMGKIKCMTNLTIKILNKRTDGYPQTVT